jgi:hypothetical protein
MTNLEFPSKPYMLFWLEKPTFMLLAIALSFVKLYDPYERFVMLLKSRPHTHHPNMHCSYTGGRRKNMPSI